MSRPYRGSDDSGHPRFAVGDKVKTTDKALGIRPGVVGKIAEDLGDGFYSVSFDDGGVSLGFVDIELEAVS